MSGSVSNFMTVFTPDNTFATMTANRITQPPLFIVGDVVAWDAPDAPRLGLVRGEVIGEIQSIIQWGHDNYPSILPEDVKVSVSRGGEIEYLTVRGYPACYTIKGKRDSLLFKQDVLTLHNPVETAFNKLREEARDEIKKSRRSTVRKDVVKTQSNRTSRRRTVDEDASSRE